MAGAYLYAPVDSWPDSVHPMVGGFGQTAALVSGIVSGLAQAGTLAYQAYLTNLQATEARHEAARQAEADRQAAIAVANKQAEAAIAAAQVAEAQKAAGQTAALQAGGAGVTGGISNTWLIAGGVGALGLVLMLTLGRRR